MADLVQTAANVALGGSAASVRVVIARETVTQGQPGYEDADGRWGRAANTSLVLSRAAGFFLTPATAGQPVVVVTGDNQLVNLGATLVIGKTYVLSVLGKVSPIDDVASGDWLTLLGTGATANLLRTKFDSTGIQVA